MTEIVKIYIPTPTKKGGVVEVEAVQHKYDHGGYSRVFGHGYFWSSAVDKDWFLDKAKALAAAEAARIKRIASLEKQIAKLAAIGPFVVKESST